MAGGTLVLGIIGYSVSSHLLVLIFFIGFGLGSLELSGSNIISEIQPKNKGRYLNVLNAFYGVGAVITPVLAGYLLNVGISWRLIYQYSLVFVVPITIYFLVMKYPKSKTEDEESNNIHFRSLLRIISKREILLMYLVIFAYVATEIGMATWMVDFYRKRRVFLQQ